MRQLYTNHAYDTRIPRGCHEQRGETPAPPHYPSRLSPGHGGGVRRRTALATADSSSARSSAVASRVVTGSELGSPEHSAVHRPASNRDGSAIAAGSASARHRHRLSTSAGSDDRHTCSAKAYAGDGGSRFAADFCRRSSDVISGRTADLARSEPDADTPHRYPAGSGAVIYESGLLCRYTAVCPFCRCRVGRTWLRRSAVLLRDLHAAVCRFNRPGDHE